MQNLAATAAVLTIGGSKKTFMFYSCQQSPVGRQGLLLTRNVSPTVCGCQTVWKGTDDRKRWQKVLISDDSPCTSTKRFVFMYRLWNALLLQISIAQDILAMRDFGRIGRDSCFPIHVPSPRAMHSPHADPEYLSHQNLGKYRAQRGILINCGDHTHLRKNSQCEKSVAVTGRKLTD